MKNKAELFNSQEKIIDGKNEGVERGEGVL
jgi:hypothetical protein